MNKWWGYIHIDGSIHVKIYFDQRDISEAWESPFVQSVYGPWECKGREDAIERLKQSSNRG